MRLSEIFLKFFQVDRTRASKASIRSNAIEPKLGVALRDAVEGLEDFGMRLRPLPFDRESFAIRDVVRPFVGVGPVHD